MTQRRAGDGIAGLSTRLFVLFLAMVVAGFVLPSPGISAPQQPVPESLYGSLRVPARPTELIVPAIALRAPIVPIEIDPAGVLTPPRNVHQVGWWKRSAKPGATSGQTLITGHTVHNGGGVMNRLGELQPGSLVRVRTPRGVVDYRTTEVFTYSKAELAEHAQELFSQKRKDYRLVLVTCTGWTGHDYTGNIIVFADLMGVRKPGTTDAQANEVAAVAGEQP